MIAKLKDLWPFGTVDLAQVQRNLDLRYLPNEADHAHYREHGYVLLRRAIRPEQLASIQASFDQLTQLEEYQLGDKFMNSGRFASPAIRQFVMNAIGRFSDDVLPGLFHTNIYDPNTTGAFQIKPPSGVSELNPHQDSPVIDETKQNALFVWVPLCDITEQNGPVWVLPGSHLWGNHQRSLNVPWLFERHTKTLWKHMFPVCMQKGDILCWDTALIHASSPNRSDTLRVALTTTLLPKNYTLVDYYQGSDTPAGMIERYEVDRSFWETEDILKRPPCPPNRFTGLERSVFPADLPRRGVLQLIRQHLPKTGTV